MKIFNVKSKKIPGTRYSEVNKKAYYFYLQIKSRSKRRPYIRSKYFNKEKIFLELFWVHLREKKNMNDKTRRAKYFHCAIELIERSNYEPISKENPNKRSELLHRFAGLTKDDELFFVQIKEDKRSGKKWLISVFPLKNK